MSLIKDGKEKYFQKVMILASATAVFLVAMIVAALYAPVNPSQAVENENLLSFNNYYLNLSYKDKVTLTTNPDLPSEMAMMTDDVVVRHNAPGYRLYLSMDNDEVNGNRLYLDGKKTSQHFLKPTEDSSMTVDQKISMNSWGFSLAGNLNNFKPVPLKGLAHENLIKRGQGANPSGDITKVYYGARTNAELPAGSYRGVVMYSAVAEAAVNEEGDFSISPNFARTTVGGELVTIKTTLMAEGVNLGAVQAKINNKLCANLTITSRMPLTMTCNVPANVQGLYDVEVVVPNLAKAYAKTKVFAYHDTSKTFGGIVRMQEMTPEICNNETTPTNAAILPTTNHSTDQNYIPQAILYDVRDMKTYVVRKYANGACWMAQNLALELDGNKDLTNIETDLNTKTSWRPKESTQVMRYDTALGEEVGDSWYSLDYYYAKSIKPRSVQYCYGTSVPQTCGETGGTAVNSTGYFYNWPAATAWSGQNIEPIAGDVVRNDSICPKGWQLPLFYRPGVNDAELDRTFNGMVYASGLSGGGGGSSQNNDPRTLGEPLSLTLNGEWSENSSNNKYSAKGNEFRYLTARGDTAKNDYFSITAYSRMTHGSGGVIRCVARKN